MVREVQKEVKVQIKKKQGRLVQATKRKEASLTTINNRNHYPQKKEK